MKKLTLVLSFVLGLFSITNTQAQIKVLSNGDVKISSSPTSTAVRGIEIVKPNFIFKGSSMKFTFNDKTLEISSPDNSFIMPTSSGEVSPEGALLPSTGNITILGPKDAVELGSTTQPLLSTATTTIYKKYEQTLSDFRYKTNVQDLGSASDKIMRLRPVTFDYLGEKEDISTLDSNHLGNIGLIAQEVEKVIPEAVQQLLPEDIYTINYTMLIPVLIKAIQEQQIVIENQQLQIEELQMALMPDNAAMVTPTFSNVQPNGNPAETVAAAGNKLWSNVPNPFKQETHIRYALTEDVREAQLCIYDLSGRQLSCHRLNDRGESEFVLRAAALNPGIYLYSLIADGQVVDTHRMVVTE